MPRTAAKISQADIARVLRAVAASGVRLVVEVRPDGSIRLEPVEASSGVKVDSGTKWVP